MYVCEGEEKKKWKIPYVSLSFTYIYMNMCVFSAIRFCYFGLVLFQRIVCATQHYIERCRSKKKTRFYCNFHATSLKIHAIQNKYSIFMRFYTGPIANRPIKGNHPCTLEYLSAQLTFLPNIRYQSNHSVCSTDFGRMSSVH